MDCFCDLLGVLGGIGKVFNRYQRVRSVCAPPDNFAKGLRLTSNPENLQIALPVCWILRWAPRDILGKLLFFKKNCMLDGQGRSGGSAAVGRKAFTKT